MINWYLFESKNAQATALASRIASDIQYCLTEKEQAILCVPGGNTPSAFLEALSHQPLDWKNITVILNDERWVPLTDSQSNEAKLYNSLKKNTASNVNILGYYPQSLTNEDLSLSYAVDTFNRQYKAQIKPDICVVGMGEDGHFASLFPNMPNLQLALDLKQNPALLAVKPDGKEHRVTLNLSSILCAKKHYLLITGSRKKQLVKDAVIKSENQYPITHLLKKTTIDIYYAE